MNYIERKVLHYTIICSEITNKPFNLVFEKLSRIFACTVDEREKISNFINNRDFLSLRSIKAIAMRINFIHSFCNDSSIFGNQEDEEECLIIKKNAYSFITEMRKDLLAANDLRAVLVSLFEKDNKYALLYSLVLYCQDADVSNVLMYIKKAIREGNIDAMIVALAFVQGRQERESLLTEIEKKDVALLYAEVVKRVFLTYKNNLCERKNGGENSAE